MVTFSIILPTIGRTTLGNTFRSFCDQLQPGDEVLIVRDSSNDSGNTARNDAIARARGTHLLFVDDDDEFLPGALAAIRAFAAENPGRIGIFRLHNELEDGPWRRHDLRDTGSPNYCIPNVPGKVGRFFCEENPRRGDIHFIRETVALQGEPLWRPERIVVIRPEKSRWRRLRFRLAPRQRFRARFRGGSRDGIWRDPDA
jgi:glycosyltransferase involved in cell wall biosynthesis